MATIQEVARLAGVSTASVSHVLNGTRFVSPVTRAAIEAAIAKLDYQPSAVARGLSTRQTRAIGVVIADVTAPFFARLLRAVEDLLTTAGYSTVVMNTYEDATREARALDALRQRRVDGIVITPTGAPQEAYSGLTADGCPLVFVERMPPGAHGALAAIDNYAAAAECVAYLDELGHSRVSLLALDDATTAVSARTEGFEHARHKLGLDLDPRLLVPIGHSYEAAREAVEELLAMDQPPTAIIAGNHGASVGALRAIRQAGLRIPEDVSVIVFDNSPWTEVTAPPLTAVTKPIDELAQWSVAQLLGSIPAGRRRHESSGGGRTVQEPSTASALLPAKFNRRGSCAALDSTQFTRKGVGVAPLSGSVESEPA